MRADSPPTTTPAGCCAPSSRKNRSTLHGGQALTRVNTEPFVEDISGPAPSIAREMGGFFFFFQLEDFKAHPNPGHSQCEAAANYHSQPRGKNLGVSFQTPRMPKLASSQHEYPVSPPPPPSFYPLHQHKIQPSSRSKPHRSGPSTIKDLGFFFFSFLLSASK